MNLALFDFDGTITSNNTWTPFLKYAVHPSRMLVGRLLLLPVIAGHRIGVVPASRGRQLANWVAFAGERSSALRQCGVQYATDVLPRTVRQSALDRIKWHQSQGDDVTGRCVHGDCSGAEKVRRIRERFDLAQYTLVYAYGDTPDDREMLELAHRKYYRGKEVAGWGEVSEFDDPPASVDVDGGSQAG